MKLGVNNMRLQPSIKTLHKTFEIDGRQKFNLGKESLKSIELFFFTDPLSVVSYCFLNQLDALQQRFNATLKISYKMTGLIPLWEVYRSSGISTYQEMQRYWKRIGATYNKQINGQLWLIDPPNSSIPPSIAFKAAQLQSETKALKFYRCLLLLAFEANKNISLWSTIEEVANFVDLDIQKLKRDYSGDARIHFDADVDLMTSWDLHGVPTLVVVDEVGNRHYSEGYQVSTTIEALIRKSALTN